MALFSRIKIHGISFTLSGTSPRPSDRNSPLVYYTPDGLLPSVAVLAGISPDVENRLNPRAAAALRVIMFFSMRSCEYLRLTDHDIMKNDRVIVHGAKGSASYIITLPGVCAQFNPFFSQLTPRPLAGASYRQLYTACVLCGLGIQYKGHVNMSRTHSSRHELVSELKATQDSRVLSDCLHHRKASTIKYYGGGR